MARYPFDMARQTVHIKNLCPTKNHPAGKSPGDSKSIGQAIGYDG
jgi:hypothetical protein